MDDNVNTNAYIAFLVICIGLTLLVGQMLIRSGRPYLEEVFGDRKVATSVTRLLAVLFHLLVLGVIALISIIDIPVDGALQATVAKFGIVLLVLGIAQGGTMVVLSKLRERRLAQQLVMEGSPNATLHDALGPPEKAEIHADGVVIRPTGGANPLA
jgi:hypothetical protein